MASCQTPQWSGQYTPYVRLTVTESSSTATSSTLSYTLEYIVPYSAAQTGAARAYAITIAGSKVKEGTYDINGKGKGTYTITTGTKTINKTTSSQTISFGVSFNFNLTWSGVYGGTKSASSSISIGAKTSYKISYNANGGSGAPSAQTKWHGTNITLSSTKPTRTGYSFQGWATSISGSVAYASGATYTGNANATLYAVWKANTYTISYNANGGSGAPSAQTKTYGVTLTLSSTKPTRTNYTFKGWSTSASSTTVAYKSGGSYTANSGATLYAVWELSYVKPRINNFTANRCNSSGTLTETGTYAKVTFSWASDKTVTAIKIEWKTQSASSWSSVSVSASGTSGSVSQVIGSGGLNNETSYLVRAYISDASGTTYSPQISLGTIVYPIDVKKGGTGVAFGKVAEDDIADFGFKVKLGNGLEPVFLEANTDLNNVRTPNFYTGENISSYNYGNCPLTGGTFYLEVVSCGADGQVRQTITSCDKDDLITYVRFYYTNSWGAWIDYSVGYKQIITVIGNGDTTLSSTETTEVSMKGSVVFGTKLTNNTKGQVVIGSGVKYVKIEASLYAYSGFTAGDLLHLNILKNTSVVYAAMHRIQGTYETVSGASKIISVSEGDIIKLCARNQTAGRGLLSGNGNATYMTVEVIG